MACFEPLHRVARVACNGGCRANIKTEPACVYGCVGCGICIDHCPHGAIFINDLGVAQVDETVCRGCGVCVDECPRHVISLHDHDNCIAVLCSNEDKGAAAKQVCQVSCIGCGICAKTCCAEAIHIVNNVAVIDEQLCLSCGMCATKCPRHAIVDLRGILTSAPGQA